MGMRLQPNDTQSNDLHSNNARLIHKLFLPLHVSVFKEWMLISHSQE